MTAEARQYASGALFELDESTRDPRNGHDGGGASVTIEHVMLSYNWDHQSVIKRVNASLQARGYVVWIDVEKMQGSTVEVMSAAVEDANGTGAALRIGHLACRRSAARRGRRASRAPRGCCRGIGKARKTRPAHAGEPRERPRDDSRDGTSADSALRTIAAALPLVRKLKAAALLLDGQFRLAEPLTLNAPLAGLRVDKWPGRPAPVLSGAQALPSGSWQPVRSGDIGGVFRAPLTPAQAAALDGAGAVIVGGKKFSPLRTPTQHWNTSLGGTRNAPENVLGFVYGEGTIDPNWSLAPESLARWTVAAFHSWNKAYHKVKAVFPHNRTILFETPAEDRWYAALTSAGIDPARMSGGGGFSA